MTPILLSSYKPKVPTSSLFTITSDIIKSASITEALNLYEHRLILLILIGKAYTPGNQGKIAYQRIRLFNAIIL